MMMFAKGGRLFGILAVFAALWCCAKASSCLDGAQVDIVFVLDSSGSVTSGGFSLLKDFVENLVSNFNIGSSSIRVGVVKFSTTAGSEFYLNSYFDKNAMISAIRGISFTRGGTNTDRPGILNVGVVITDGTSNDPQATSSAARHARNAGITMFAIGVSNADRSELDAIASDPDSSHVIVTSGFGDLSRIKSTFETVVCRAAIRCSSIPSVSHSRVSCTDSTRYLSRCTYTCDSGYELHGSQSVTCQANKAWTTPPTCPPIKCPWPSVPNSQRNCTDINWYMSECNYTCDVGYELLGPPHSKCEASKSWSTSQSCPEACSWVRHHCWPGDCAGNYASNCVCRPGFSRRIGSDELCDPDIPPDLHTCHLTLTDIEGDVYNASYPDSNNTECGTQNETWIQADPDAIHFQIQVDLNTTLGPFVDYVSESQVGIVGVVVTMIRVNVSGDETLVQNETLDGWPYCQQSVNSTSPLNNDTAFTCEGMLTVPPLNLTGGESLCIDIVAYSGGYYRLQDEMSTPKGEHIYNERATATKRVCFFRDCFDGWYTRRCDVECLNCDITGSCVRDTGVCDYGCKPGWIVGNGTDFCNTTCPEYYYGKDCRFQCGNCWNSTSCRHDNGTCKEGCAEDYREPLCQRRLTPVLALHIAFGTLAGLSLLGAVVLLVMAILRRKKQKTANQTSVSPEPTPPETPRSVSDVTFTPESAEVFSFFKHPLFTFRPSQNPSLPRPLLAENKRETPKTKNKETILRTKKPSSAPSTQKAFKRKTRPSTVDRDTSARGHNHDDATPYCEFRFLHSSCNRPCCAAMTCTTPNCPIHTSRSTIAAWLEN